MVFGANRNQHDEPLGCALQSEEYVEDAVARFPFFDDWLIQRRYNFDGFDRSAATLLNSTPWWDPRLRARSLVTRPFSPLVRV